MNRPLSSPFPGARVVAVASMALALVVLARRPARADQPPSSAACPSTLAEILDRVRRSPRAEAERAEEQAAEALVLQAGARPNPEVSVEVEDFTGSGQYSAFGQTQTTVALAQRIELGGLRARRVDLARRESSVTAARGDQDTAGAAVAATQRYIDALAAREREAIASEGERLAAEVRRSAERSLAAGAGAPADIDRARIAEAQASLQKGQAIRDRVVAEGRLAALWGGDERDAACLANSLPRSLPPLKTTVPPTSAATRSPAVATAEAEIAAGRAAVDLAKAGRAPDLEVGAGLRQLAGPGEVSVVAGIRIEVPVFDRRDGAIAAAEQKLLATQARALAVRRETDARVARLAQTVELQQRQLQALDRTMLPAAERAWTTLSGAWKSGAASVLDVLDARRVLLELRLQRSAALREAHAAAAALDGVLGLAGDTEASVPLSAAIPAATVRK